LVFEGGRPRAGGARYPLGNVDEILVGRAGGRGVQRVVEMGVRRMRIGVPDRRVSSEHAVVRRERGGYVFEDLGSRNGSRVQGVEVTGPIALHDGDTIEVGHTFFRFRAALPTSIEDATDLDASDLPRDFGFATLLPSLGARMRALHKIARARVSVLLSGETGTGKEVLARAIHAASGRKGAFVAVNCGALPAQLVEALLFGHVRGAFTGAVRDEEGFVRSANGGTLFLDELGDLPAPAQATLLRVLQENEVLPVGSTQAINVDVRIVSATHVDLEQKVRSGAFREDLFARVAAFMHPLPPLRERREDLGLILARCLDDVWGRAAVAALETGAARALLAYGWPRNIRELRQALEVAAALGAPEQPLRLADLPPPVASASLVTHATRVLDVPAKDSDAELRRTLVAALVRHRGNVSDVARALGKARMQIHRWMRRFALDPEQFRK
jgi:DNA-binding NtrC family response regulator